jgi:hypothetical protein
MPVILPSSSSLGCIKIARLENGMLADLAEGWVTMMAGMQIAAGSTILLTSATNMAHTGTTGYTEDLVNAIRYLKRQLGDHVIYSPLPNMLLNGCKTRPQSGPGLRSTAGLTTLSKLLMLSSTTAIDWWRSS